MAVTQPNPRTAKITQVSEGASHIARVFRTLEALVSGPKMASDIAQMLGVNRSTALRLMSEIEALGYIDRAPDTKVYSIVPAKFYPFISAHTDHLDWSGAVDPILSELREELGESAIMGVPANGAMVYLAFYPSMHLIMVRERLGTTRPIHCSALGKAYLSALDDPALDAELAMLDYRGGTRFAARGPMELRERVADARGRGYAIDLDETAEGASCVAVPAHIGGSLVGAIGISGPSSRMDEQRIEQMGKRLIEAARRLAESSR